MPKIFATEYPWRRFTAENFVAGLHVGEVQISEHIRKQSQHFIVHHMPEVNQAIRSAS
jgi:hypothetical protein